MGRATEAIAMINADELSSVSDMAGTYPSLSPRDRDEIIVIRKRIKANQKPEPKPGDTGELNL